MNILHIGMAVARVATAVIDEERVGRVQDLVERGYGAAARSLPDARRRAEESRQLVEPGDVEIWQRFRDAFPEAG